MTHLYSKLILFVLAVASQINVSAQSKPYTPVSPELYNTILQMDSLLFDAVNTGNVEKESAFFMKDLEFYHDKGGLDNYDRTIEKFKIMASSNTSLRRVLVKESVEVYPVKDYGAIQTGEHRFCQLVNGTLVNCGTFKFMHIWKKTDEGWKISRVISYDH
ncbi:nuclear transport factor 2 family protein [Sphingobacterium spiritivorum]|uniref:DUF4440 domain-containing protein n=1 Tax=Sphingobacterium spiritivorum ATCC 33861 TaxID=525373 RepID=D7VSD3_SPHSI|nr:nuclear transport factor 2 family protein [Sphingobacterium spiritivorum]EFK56684.1 hypothetical protein HMPREF0766_13887 [Sphingobacterium spiritivorum ATCC 33861]QQT35275.1 nuclear transport factor 2 family protein [Sphingobacterium spiritivorum]WQD36190.1 nuclear transport factor 2 family protein [Sphingobacterium spiritivorum]SUJ04467.1 Uncharacterised protein [Sphingobacterium spiritivorum]